MKEQQSTFIKVMYNNWEVFWLHDEDLGCCDWITHTIQMWQICLCIYHTIQYLGNHKRRFKNVWTPGWDKALLEFLKVLMDPRLSWYEKKSWEIYLCIDYWKLNSITVHDAFPLLKIDEVLLAIDSSMWFASFNLAEGISNWKWRKAI